MQHSSYSYGSSSFTSATVALYAHNSAPNWSFYDNWYIFSSSNSFTTLFKTYVTNYNEFYCIACHSPVQQWIYYSSHYKPYTPDDFDVVFTNVGMNALKTTLQLSFTLTPTHPIIMNSVHTKSFPEFRFLINNYYFTCSGFSKFNINMKRLGWNSNVSPINNFGPTLSCSGVSEITLQFYYYLETATWGTIWGGEVSPWTSDTTLTFDI